MVRCGSARELRDYCVTFLLEGCDAAQHSAHTSPRRVSVNARMRLTLEQAQRLCGVERTLCKAVFDALVADKFLCVKSDRAYARLTEGIISRPRPVKADLGAEQRVATAS